MHGVGEPHGLVRTQGIQQIFVKLDERLLLCFVELAGNVFRLVVFQAKPMQEGDQSRAALVGDAEFLLDIGAGLARRARQRRANPCLQLVLLLAARPTGAAASLKSRQPFEAFLDERAMPSADRIVVQRAKAKATSSQLQPASRRTNALARRCAAAPSRATAIRSARSSGDRKPQVTGSRR